MLLALLPLGATSCGGGDETTGAETATKVEKTAGPGTPVEDDGWRVTVTRTRTAAGLKVKDSGVTFTGAEICTGGVCEAVPPTPTENLPPAEVMPGSRFHSFLLVRMRFENLRPTQKRAISSPEVALVAPDGKRLRAIGFAKSQYGPPRFAGCTDCTPTMATTSDAIVAELAFQVKKADAGKTFKVRFRNAPEIAFSLPG